MCGSFLWGSASHGGLASAAPLYCTPWSLSIGLFLCLGCGLETSLCGHDLSRVGLFGTKCAPGRPNVGSAGHPVGGSNIR